MSDLSPVRRSTNMRSLFLAMLLLLAPTARGDLMKLYIGGYSGPSSEGIYCVSFDDAKGEFVGEPKLVATVKNPSFLALAPNGKTLYSVAEVGGGAVSAFAIDAVDAPLRHLNDAKSGGAGPCHLTVMPDGRTLVVANYGSGHFASLRLNDDGSIGDAVSSEVGAGGGPIESRQKGPHGHSVVPSPVAKDLFAACDLGSDEVTIFRAKADASIEVVSRVKSPAGAGPRMSTWSRDGTKLYVADELSNTLSIYTWDGTALKLASQVDALSPEVSREALSLAHVSVTDDGRTAYVSIRDNSKGPDWRDAIAVVDVSDASKPRVVQHVQCARVPRHIALAPGGKWLVVAGQKSGTLVAHKIDPATGHLGPAGPSINAGIPTCVLPAQ
jgi:6-phosphogluconolactonase